MLYVYKSPAAFALKCCRCFVFRVRNGKCIVNTLKRNGMRKRYCTPVAESICIETYIIAASTGGAGEKAVNDVDEGDGSCSWDNIWN